MSRALRMGSLAAAPARHITPEILAAAAVMLACPPRANRPQPQVIGSCAANVDKPCAETVALHAPRMFHG
jgi:hypothetical protein